MQPMKLGIPTQLVMSGLGPGIHFLAAPGKKDVDGRDI
jgi:hypothetical protein